MSYLPCTDPIPPCPTCLENQVCIQTSRSNTQCAQNICISSGTSSTTPSTNPIGTTIGGALGGVLSIIVAVGLLYWFWWKPRGLAASRKRYSKHISARQSRVPNGIDKSNLRKLDEDTNNNNNNTASKRTSIHIRMEESGEAKLSRRGIGGSGSNSENDEILMDSNIGTKGHSRNLTMETDNPFDDNNRSSMGHDRPISTRTSEFSFRSSTSTNIIPIAYIPPHSNSMSLEDSNNRGAYGELLTNENKNVAARRTSNDLRYSVPMSIASNDSSELLHDSPTIPPIAISSGGAPIRPLRSPGLDLQLPKPTSSPPKSPLYQQSQSQRPPSGFPWEPSTPSNLGTNSTSNSTTPRGVSTFLGRKNSHLSTYSTMSSSTNRSDGSTLSYILDPPQIITPVNAQGLRRFEVLGTGKADLVTISSRPGTSPTIFAPSTGTSVTPIGNTFSAQQLSVNPFSDQASISPNSTRFSVGDIATSSNLPDSFEQSRERPDSNSTNNSSYKDSHATINERIENSSRNSYTSARSEVSSQYLDGIPFQSATSSPPRSPLFPLPPPRDDNSPRSSFISSTETSYFHPEDDELNPYPSNSSFDHIHSTTVDEEQDLSPLPTPYLPFAGQRPTSNNRVQSQIISLRSGFGSGLSQIPFQLGFPSGLDEGGSERGSMISLDSTRDVENDNHHERDSVNYPAEEEEIEGEENPFGEHAEIS